ncbi:MAG: ABC transporter ATP-binding protein, partial [Actinobacteria bacterium]|nr:ABC transporter ATP-binding protein [Actinomycetota bacterium]
TMRMIAGLEQITDGNIYINNKKVNDLDPATRNVALAFESYALYQHMTVRENISFCLKVKKFSKKEIEEKINWAGNLLGISEILESKPASLSGGQQQLVSVARALIRKPSVTLLDEPISHLDTRTRLKISLKIRQIQNETKLTMVYVTHNQEEALALADKIAVMNNGELQQVGERSKIIDKPINTFVADFIGEPSINFIECQLLNDNNTLKAVSENGSFQIKLDKEIASTVKYNNLDNLIIGIRPIDLYTEQDKKDSKKIVGEIIYFEFLGETGIVKARIGGQTDMVVVVNPSLKFKKGEKIDLYFNIEKVHFFNPGNGIRILKNKR